MTAVAYPIPSTVAAMAPEQHFVIEASAGTGKTFVLEHRVVDLLVRGGATIDEILVVTFTEKATAELRARLRALIERVLAGNVPPGSDPAAAQWHIGDEVRTRLRAALNRFDEAAISTIHGFCNRVLSENALASRQLLEQTQVPEEVAFTRAFYSALRENIATSDELLPYLEAWLSSGKTVARLCTRLLKCHSAGAVIWPPFDEARLREAAAALAPDAAAMTRSEFLDRAIAEGIAKSSAKALADRFAGVRSALLDTTGEPLAILAALPDKLDYLFKNDPTAGPIGEVHQRMRALAEAAVPVEAAVPARLLPVVGERLVAEKLRLGELDFGDMLTSLWDALDGSSGDLLTRRLRQQYKFALIDEFQDTDPVQWNIFRRLYLDDGATGYLAIIGDPKQAIYGFRGADLHTYLRARQTVQEAGGELVRLENNYRSTPALIEAYNGLFADKPEPYFTGDIAYRDVVAGTDRRLVAGGEPIAPVCIYRPAATKVSPTDFKERIHRFIGGEIERLIASGVTLEDGERSRKLTYGDIFVLTRAGYEAEAVAAELSARRIPNILVAERGLFATPEARDIRDVLAAIARPASISARVAAWATRWFDMPLTELSRMASAPEGHALHEQLYRWHQLAERRDFEQLFTAIAQESRIVERSIVTTGSAQASDPSIQILERLLEDIAAHPCSLTELIRRLDNARHAAHTEDGDLLRAGGDADAVVVMTVHKAKGLEAGIVFLHGGYKASGNSDAIYHHGEERRMLIGRSHSDKAIADAEQRQEDERLYYVAVTRAIGRVYLPHDQHKQITNGSYAPLHSRLSGFGTTDERLFSLAEVDDGAAAADDVDLSGFAVQASALTPAPAAPLADIVRDRAGFTITSYSQLKHGADNDFELPVARIAADKDGLPGGREVGLLFHEVLEHLDLARARAHLDFSSWAGDPSVEAVFAAARDRYRLGDAHLDTAKRWVHAAVTQPLAGAESTTGELPALCNLSQVERELEFLFPLGSATGSDVAGGFIDAVFVHDGRIYAIDWKSDRLDSYDDDSLAAHVATHYQTQVDLYGAAIARILSIESAADHERLFGGIGYWFLRGQRPLWFRPDHDDLGRRLQAVARSVPRRTP